MPSLFHHKLGVLSGLTSSRPVLPSKTLQRHSQHNTKTNSLPYKSNPMSTPLHKTTPSEAATKSPMFLARQDTAAGNRKPKPLEFPSNVTPKSGPQVSPLASPTTTTTTTTTATTATATPGSSSTTSVHSITSNPMLRGSLSTQQDYPLSPKKSKFLSPQHWQGTVGEEKNNGTIKRQSSVAKRQQQDNIDKEEAVKNMYHKTHFSSEWMYATIVMHLFQFSLLLSVGMAAVPLGSAVMIMLLVVNVALILVVARCRTNKLPKAVDWSYKTIRTPEQETDDVSDNVIYLLAAAVLLESIAYALYPVSAVFLSRLDNRSDSITQILCFAAIINLSFHRIIRPANRLDPLRTILELEITNICWDALDGASLFALLVDTENLSDGTDASARLLMCFWYLSIGLRQAMMFGAHLSPSCKLYTYLLPPATTWSSEPTVDRTLGAITLKTKITISMALSQFFAAGLRLSLWKRGQLDTLQQEMMVKNILYLGPTGTAVLKYYATSGRYWNSRVVIDKPIAILNCRLAIIKPQRNVQIEILRYVFVVAYLVVGSMFSSFLTHVTDESFYWICNVGTDIGCMILFLILCRNIHNPEKHIIFPKKLAGYLSVLLVFNLFIARVPAIYLNVDEMEPEGEDWSFQNALLIILASIIPITSYGLFWSLCNMMYHSEFTTCPGNKSGTIASYNGIHDPSITLVSVQTMLEGALDIVSCSALVSFALEDLPTYLDWIIIVFAFLEIINACQCFILQVVLAGGHGDTPADLVLLRAKLRRGRGCIDFFAFILRLVMWLRYDAVASVFMIKNLSNLLHTVALIERGKGVENYTKHTLFMQYVMPKDWYGMNMETWRMATKQNTIEQAQSGRVV